MPPPNIAHCQDADEDDIEHGPVTYAKSVAPGSPVKERPNTGRSRNTTPEDSDSEPETPSRRVPKMRTKDERRSSKAKVVSGKESARRPSARSSKTTSSVPFAGPPPMLDDPSYYGARREVAGRPRSRPRSETFAGPPGPPMVRPPRQPPGMQYHPGGPPPMHRPMGGGPPFPPPGHGYPPGSFPGPGSWGGPPPPLPPPGRHGHMGPPPISIPGGPPSMAGPPRSHRGHSLSFTPDRPASAAGFHGPGSYEQERRLARRPSAARKTSKEQDDRMRMPPPARPFSAHPNTSAFRPPPAQKPQLSFREAKSNKRSSKIYDDDDDDFDNETEYYPPPMMSRRQPSTEYTGVFDDDDDSEDEVDDYRREMPASSGRRRRTSTYDHGGGVPLLTDAMRRVSMYQNQVSGATPQAQLTADALRKVRHGNGPSSRSTQSSASRDESDYRHSATTRTTRSGPNGEDITIKVPRGAVVEVGGAKITCRDGGDLNFPRPNESRGGSDRETEYEQSLYDDFDDRATRVDHPAALTRTRADSRRRSYSRGYPSYEGSYSAHPSAHPYNYHPSNSHYSYYQDEYPYN